MGVALVVLAAVVCTLATGVEDDSSAHLVVQLAEDTAVDTNLIQIGESKIQSKKQVDAAVKKHGSPEQASKGAKAMKEMHDRMKTLEENLTRYIQLLERIKSRRKSHQAKRSGKLKRKPKRRGRMQRTAKRRQRRQRRRPRRWRRSLAEWAKSKRPKNLRRRPRRRQQRLKIRPKLQRKL